MVLRLNVIIIVYFCFLFTIFHGFYDLSKCYNLTGKDWSLDLTVIFLRSGTPTKVKYDVQQTMIFLIRGAVSVCNFFLMIVNKFLVYTSIDLIYIYFFSNTFVVSVNVFYRQAFLYQYFSARLFLLLFKCCEWFVCTRKAVI